MNAAAPPASPAVARLLCDRVICNIASATPGRFAGKTADVLRVTWLDTTRRAIRKRAASGREVGVLLPLGVTLAHGDVLHEADSTYVIADVEPCELWVIRASSPDALARIALELGNLHVPAEVIAGGELLTPPDGPTEGVLRRNGATYEHTVRRFAPLRATVTSGLAVTKGLTIVKRERP